MKLIGNSLILGSMELIAEAYTVAEKSGVGQEVIYEYIKGNSRIVPEAQFTDVTLTYRNIPRSDVSELLSHSAAPTHSLLQLALLW